MRTIWNEQVYLKAPSKSQSRNTTNANKDDNKKAETAMSHDESPNTTATVHIDSAGEISIQCNQSVADFAIYWGCKEMGSASVSEYAILKLSRVRSMLTLQTVSKLSA